MTKRIFRSICIVAITVFLAALVLILGVLYDHFSTVQANQLRMQTDIAAHGVEQNGMDFFEGLDIGDYRITWVNADGDVLYDSSTDTSDMENHGEREEINEALKNGYGESERRSETLMEHSLYCAKRLADGTVLRLSVAQSTVWVLVLGMLQPTCAVIIFALLLSLLLANRLSKKIVEPLNSLDLDKPLSDEGYDELAPLLRRIDSQQKQLRRQETRIQRKRMELEAVTGSMNEGLVLLNTEGQVLSINRAAAALLGTYTDCIGQNILEINRMPELYDLLNRSLEGERCETTVDLAGGRYQLDASPVISNEVVSGIALLMFDVTEKESSEQMRREFTANVSHELKTPLHSISGYAELLSNGMVKPDDVGTFAEKIYTEAQRMVHLVEDIIRLSRLDEGAEDMKREETDLYQLAAETVRSLEPVAEKAGVKLNLTGESVSICAIPQLVGAMIYNLCDNAIKYNRKNGRVNVNIALSGTEAVLTVKDTGIGIPPEHQTRVFERFYRVDKSHSKAVGGTGLGLSIVKHSARIHNARLELQSVVNEGTTVTVRFPK